MDPSDEHVVVLTRDGTLVDTRDPVRVLETSHPPTYYLPRSDTRMASLRPNPRRTICEWKGVAEYFDLVVGDLVLEAAVWSYPEPALGFEAIAGHLAIYPQAAERITVDGEIVRSVQGDFYGGWVTSRVVGPFKGEVAGSHGW